MDTWIKIVVCFVFIQACSPAPVSKPKILKDTVYNVSDEANLFRDTHLHDEDNFGLKCTLRPIDEGLHTMVTQIIERFAKLIEYELHIVTGNYTENPLLVNETVTYKSNKWARVGSSQGLTILNLAFNYDVLSLKTLSFGIEKLKVELAEEPEGCIGELSEFERIQVVMDILLRDFDPRGPITVLEGEASLCHQVIQERNGTGKFTDRCCQQAFESIDISCFINPPNKYLNYLDKLLVVLSLGVFLFGLALTPSWLYLSTMHNIPYYVKLKEPLYKTLVVTSREDAAEYDIKPKHVMKVNNYNYPMLFSIISELPQEAIIPIKIDQFDIDVSYRKMNVEHQVPVGIMTGLARAIFQCKLHELGPFEDCCNANVTGCLRKGRLRWKNLCSFFGRVLFVFFMPFPFYIRLVVYYFFEYPEIQLRKAAAENIGLTVDYEFRIMQFLTPTHPLYLTMYVVYFAAGIRLAYTAGSKQKPHMQTAIISAFHDMKTKTKLGVLSVIVSKFLWPFKKFGIYGIFVGFLYWPIVMPFILIPAVIYYIPLFYIMIRIIQRAFIKHPLEIRPAPEIPDGEDAPKNIADRLKRMFNYGGCKRCRMYSRRPIMNIFVSLITFITLFAMMTMLAEIGRFMAEIMCFTVMGLIVNAAKVIKYGSMLFMVILYSRDCYDDVNRKYLKLNKALFNEVQRQLGGDIAEFTQLPGDLQENRGFKAVEASAQGEFEETDDLVTEGVDSYGWCINDMILLVDQKDTPRMPKKLFDQVCQLKVAGCPGPVYKSLIMATGKFLFIILFLAFVFIVVMSFGEANNFSQSSQMLAAMVGGFLPLIFNNLLKSATPQVETNLLSFKAKVGEIISQFNQVWPMTDFIFDIEEPPKSEDEEEEEGEGDDDEEQSNAGSSRDKEKEKDKKDDKKQDKKQDKKEEQKKGEEEPPWFVKAKPDTEAIYDKVHSLVLAPVPLVQKPGEKMTQPDTCKTRTKDKDAKKKGPLEIDILVHMLDWQFDSSNINLKEGKYFNHVEDVEYGNTSNIDPYAAAGVITFALASDAGGDGGADMGYYA